MPEKSIASRRVVPDTRRRDLVIAVIAGAAVLAFIVYAVMSLSRQANSSGMAEGVIISKHFVPQDETQVTFGKNGVNSREVAGEYSFQVRVPDENNREYKVLVDPRIYGGRNVGDHLLFQRPVSGTP